jgi:hypothetical protein
MKLFRRTLKWSTLLVLAAIMVYVAYFVYSMKSGEKRVTDLCRQITPGMKFSEVQTFAVEHGIDAPRLRLDADSKVAYLAERRTMGRHTCRVELEAAIVKTSEYRFYD